MASKLPDDIGAIRSRLASRQSFFGGPVSTREQCVAPSWKDLPSARTSRAGAPPAGASAGARQRVGSKPSSVPSRAPLTKEEKRRRGYSFSDLYAAPKPLPLRPKSENKAAAAAATAADASAAAAAILERATGATPPTGGKPPRSPAAKKPATSHAAADAASPAGGPPPKRKKSPKKAERMVLQPRMTALGPQTVALLRVPRRSPARSKSRSPAKDAAAQTTSASPRTAKAAPTAPPARRRVASPRTLRRRDAPKQRLKGTFYGAAQPPAARRRVRTVDDDPASDLDSFIVPGGDGDDIASDGDYDPSADGGAGTGWRGALKEALGGYDASRFAAVDALPDRRMAASYEDIVAEEARAGRIAAAVDREEAAREAAERAARLERKRKRAEERRRRRAQGEGGGEDDEGARSGDSGSSSSEEEGSSSDEEQDENDVQHHRRRRRLAGLLASM